MFKRITKKHAKKLFSEGKPIYLCPSKMNPNAYLFSPACLVFFTDDLKQSALRYKSYAEDTSDSYYPKQYAHLWLGSIEETAWDLMYNNWSYYNTSYETGYYAHYYIEVQ